MSRKSMMGNSVAEHKSHCVIYVFLFVTELKQRFEGDFSATQTRAHKGGFSLGINGRIKGLKYE